MKDIFIDFNVKFGLEKLWKWKWWVAGACVVSAFVSFFFADQIHPEYKSSAAFVPPDISSLNSMVFNSGLGYRGFEAADEEDIDRTVDYLTSRQVIDSIAKLYKLYEHYGIDRNTKNADKFFYFLYGKKNEVSYSDRSTVNIACYDVDSVWAANIANTHLEFAKDFFERVSNRRRGFEACKTQLKMLQSRRQNLLDTLALMRNDYKLYHVDHVGNNVDQLIAAQIRSNDQFNLQYDRMISSELQLNELEEQIGDLDREFISRQMNLEQYPTLIQITKIAKPTTFKARPKRAIYVAVSVLATLILAAFLVVILDRSKDRLPI